MLSMVYCEMLKLKRSKILLLSILGVMTTPFMLFVEGIQQHMEHPEQEITLSTVYSNSMLYVMVLINMMIYVTITAYLFSREYSENTWKTILPTPVPRSLILTAKFLTLLGWVLLLTVVTWLGVTILFMVFHFTIGLSEVNAAAMWTWFLRFLLGNGLVFLTLTPFAYFAERSKGLVTPMILSAVIVMGNAALCNQRFGALFPWTATYLLVMKRISETGYPALLAASLIAIIFLTGVAATYIYFIKEDLK